MQNTENIAKIDIKGFYDLCNRLKELEEENELLKTQLKLKNRMVEGLKINNSALTMERNKLLEELHEIKSLGMFEFADKYCSETKLMEAGHEFARSLGVGVSDFEKAEIAAEQHEDEIVSAMGSFLGDDL